MGTHRDNIKEFNKKLEGGGFPIPDQGGIYTKGGTEKPVRKVGAGSKSAKRDFAPDSKSGNNRPRTSSEGDTYEAKYSKTGSLTEKEDKNFDYPALREAFEQASRKKRLRENKKCKCGAEITKEGWTECKKCHKSTHEDKKLKEMAGQFPELEDDDFIPGSDPNTESDFSYLDEEIPDEEFDPQEDESDYEDYLDDDMMDTGEVDAQYAGDTFGPEDDPELYDDYTDEPTGEIPDEEFGGDGEIDMLDADSLDAMADEEFEDDYYDEEGNHIPDIDDPEGDYTENYWDKDEGYDDPDDFDEDEEIDEEEFLREGRRPKAEVVFDGSIGLDPSELRREAKKSVGRVMDMFGPDKKKVIVFDEAGRPYNDMEYTRLRDGRIQFNCYADEHNRILKSEEAMKRHLFNFFVETYENNDMDEPVKAEVYEDR